MKSLFKAIRDEFVASPALSNLVSGRLYLELAPQEDWDSYIVVYLVDLTLSEEFSYSGRIEVFRVQFSIFCEDTSVETVCGIFEQLTTVYDRVTLTFSGSDYTCVEMSRDSANLFRDDDNFWNYVTDYIVLLQPV